MTLELVEELSLRDFRQVLQVLGFPCDFHHFQFSGKWVGLGVGKIGWLTWGIYLENGNL